jgi:integrase
MTPADEISLLEKLLAERRAAQQNGGQLSENPRGEADGGSIKKEPPMCRVSKPYKNRNKWRVRVIDTETGAIKNHIFDSEELALAGRKQLEREYRRPVGVRMSEALDEYAIHLRTRGNVKNRPNKPRTVETTMQRLRGVFETDAITGELTAKLMVDLWTKWVQGKATDTALNTLAQVRTFLGWLEKRQWTKGAPILTGIEVAGIRKKGKPKLSQDEAEKLVSWCLSQPGDAGAVGTLCAYWLGMRATEIVSRTVRNLDGRGTLLDITEAKTTAGERTLKLPAKLQPLLGALAKEKQPDDKLFGEADRHWLRREVKRCCKAAGVRVVGPHGLRGTHAKVAREVGVSGVLLAAAMGHESETTTTEHYAGRAAVAQSAVERVSAALN